MKQTATTWTCEQCKKTRVVYDPPASDEELDLLERAKAYGLARIEESRWLTITGGIPPWEEHYCSRKCLMDRLRDVATAERP